MDACTKCVFLLISVYSFPLASLREESTFKYLVAQIFKVFGIYCVADDAHIVGVVGVDFYGTLKIKFLLAFHVADCFVLFFDVSGGEVCNVPPD